MFFCVFLLPGVRVSATIEESTEEHHGIYLSLNEIKVFPITEQFQQRTFLKLVNGHDELF
jgi:hypothetical protein